MKLLIAIFWSGAYRSQYQDLERYGSLNSTTIISFMTFVFCVLASLVIMLKEDRKFSRGCPYRRVYRRSQHIYTVFQPEGGRTSAGI